MRALKTNINVRTEPGIQHQTFVVVRGYLRGRKIGRFGQRKLHAEACVLNVQIIQAGGI